MKAHHWIALVVIFVIGYFVGVKWPHASSAITGAVPSVSM